VSKGPGECRGDTVESVTSMADDDYYELLGVDRGADEAGLKSAFRKKAMQYHPDRNPGDDAAEAKFKQINEAYSVLSDKDKRAAYDRYGKAAFQQGGMGGDGAGFEGFGGAFGDIFSEIFGDFMGGNGRPRGRSQAQRGGDIRHDLQITLEEAYRGKQAEINLSVFITCEPCVGSGAAPGSKPESCRQCGGQGKVRTQQGFFVVERTCPVCRGAGSIIAQPCTSCSGAGRVERSKTLQVKIPPGVADGNRIHLTGEGQGGARGGPPGDLYLFISVLPHSLFQREGTSLFCIAPLPMTTAALGGDIEVPSLDGQKTQVKIPAGTQSGRQFRLRGKGMPALNTNGFGDLIIQAAVETPVNLTRKQKELLEEFRRGQTSDNAPESEGFFQKLKNLWDDVTQ
jgi:molecular chaperone DnaJ